jgi:putative inorganic carbon (hco3(-)) transporter
MSRLHTWQMIWNLAKDNPIVGGGFDFNSPYLVQRYSPVEMLAYSPHSVYFQVLGEHGFVGLALYLVLLGYSWRRAGQLTKQTKGVEGYEWIAHLMPMIQVSIVGFAVGGAFLNLLHFDFSYYLLALIVLADLSTSQRARDQMAAKRVAFARPVASGLRSRT